MTKRNDPKEQWLQDAEVRAKVEAHKGRWTVSLIFVNTADPNQILIRQIGAYRSQKLAEIAANNMQKTAERDYRGTQKVASDAYPFNNN